MGNERTGNLSKIVVLLAENPGELGVRMHNAAYNYLALNFVYKPLAVANSEIALEEAVAQIRAPNYRGASVTMPFKQKVMPHLYSIDAVAEEIGVVNTIVNDCGFLRGYNTDWIGAIDALREVCDLQGKKAGNSFWHKLRWYFGEHCKSEGLRCAD